ncbi:helix-turn-helix domain-containing protein [Pseudoflavonifractor phocaeensis]|uniref:helix-turn-helix domain-containing protein n=1 Tax=Pseudoflavonifractor phocaeensis TaxID=1870988 RepID=UPI00210914F2|nr:helix-turn-helix transcriptional regulator [Pseudoflavonifractor phocaeensis]MCQ4862708.1 helix-turn-helix domain-containing protein [Pseudoflavonifractor phocaeensis]
MTKDELKIARLRKNGMTQKALAAEIGVHQVDVSRWESNKVKPGVDKLQAIAKVLHVNVSWVAGLSFPPY